MTDSAAWTLPAQTPFAVIENCWIPMADGVRLSARLWLPEGTAPAVLEYIPYRKADGYRGHDDLWGPQLASHGIAYARVDVRGSGDSEGVLTDEYAETELDDGVAVIAWLAAQPWCNGSVGMRGLSWGGINTLQVAARRPPALKAIMPMGCCVNRYTGDAHYIGGALGHTNFQWGTAFKTVMAGPPSPAVFGEGWRAAWRARLEATPTILETWLRHGKQDAYWRRGSVDADLGAIACPTYVVDGWSDTYTNAVDDLLRGLTAPRKGLVGPWGHTYPYTAAPLGLDWAHEEVRWWRHWLMGEATGIMDGPMLRAFMPYATATAAAPAATPGRWIAEAAWPALPIGERALHLTDGGLAEAAAPAVGRVSVSGAAVVGLTKPEWLDRLPFEQSADDARSMVFDGPALEAELEILGRPTVRLRLAADRASAHVAARLCEVTPDGRSWLVGWALLNLSHRHGHERPMPLTPGADIDVELKMDFVAHRFGRGSKVRLALSQSLWPLVWPAPDATSLSVDLSGSVMNLPVRPAEAEPAALAIPERRSPPAGSWSAPVTTTQPDPDGRYRLLRETPPSSATTAGVTITRARTELSELTPGDPLGGRWTQETHIGWAGDGFDCRVEAGYALTADAAAFHLEEWLVARDGQTVVFERRSTARVERQGR